MLSPQPPEEQCNARRLCSGGSVLYVIVNDFDFFIFRAEQKPSGGILSRPDRG